MLLTDLSKAFDFLKVDSLIAKLAVYGFDQPWFWFIYTDLSDRTQRSKVNNTRSSYTMFLKILYLHVIYFCGTKDVT